MQLSGKAECFVCGSEFVWGAPIREKQGPFVI